MGSPAEGSIILVPFPFLDLSRSKLRPAVVLAGAGQGDWVLCQVTSKAYADAQAVEIADSDFGEGGLRMLSYARPAKLFTAHESLFVAEAGRLRFQSLQRITDRVIALFVRKAP